MLRYATERTHTLKALKASEQRYRELFQNVTAGVFQTTVDGKFMAANPALVRMLGYDSEDELLAVDVARDVYADPTTASTGSSRWPSTARCATPSCVLKRRDGSKLVVLENSRAVRDADGRVLFYEGTLTDITAAHALSEQLTHDASHDPLTGLKNRREFETRLQHALELSHATGATHAVCFMDLDRFKVVNDTCGHVAGDELLRQLGQLLQAKVRSADVVARLGGDEFAILLQNCGPNDALQVANNVLKAVAGFQFVWGAHVFNLGVSIGVVVINSHFKRIAQVMSAADTACYAAKDGGRNRVVVLPGGRGHARAAARRARLGGRAKRALAENRLFLEAQPIRPLALGQPRAAALRAAGAHARRYRPRGAAGRVPADRRALQPVGALRPLGDRRRAQVDAATPRGHGPRVALLHQPVARLGGRSRARRPSSATRVARGGRRSAPARLRGRRRRSRSPT